MATGMHPEAVLGFWFGEAGEDRTALWFGADPKFDAEIRERFATTLEAVAAGRHEDWAQTARGRLALILVLDQFPRNMFRRSGRAFAYDEKARAVCLEGLDRGDDAGLGLVERAFFYLPLEHAEDPDLQALSVRCFTRLRDEGPPEVRPMAEAFLGYAEQHRQVIERFGRFPHRNALLGRPTTPEEQAFLATAEGPFRA
jgi:uncharacterized protein (DUF924 family)